MKILLFHGRGVISALIRWQTRGRFSHAAVLTRDGWLYEAWQGKGVRKKVFDQTDIVGIRAFTVEGMTPESEAKMLDYLEARLGNKYDYRGVFKFVTRRRGTPDDRDFCSEYVYSAAQWAGHHLLVRTEPWEVSPSLLCRSPRLVETVL